DAYLNAAAKLRPLLAEIDGFISIERFESLTQPGKILSLSYWRDEEAVRQWRNVEQHRRIQAAGRELIFADYRLRVAHVIRDYGIDDRAEAPADSRQVVLENIKRRAVKGAVSRARFAARRSARPTSSANLALEDSTVAVFRFMCFCRSELG
ncbi:MAG: antibiotic biosynthesis monooxygenase, partial [Betaproteobacteria bacterium]